MRRLAWATLGGVLIDLLFAAAIADAAFKIVEQIDPITDAKSVYATIGTKDQYLAIGCDNAIDRKSIRVTVLTKEYIGDSTPGILMGGTDVQYRFDQRPPQSVRWYSHERFLSAERERTDPIKFMLEMKGSTSVFIRAFNYAREAIDVRFRYQVPDEVIADVLARCGFNPDGSDPSKKKRR